MLLPLDVLPPALTSRYPSHAGLNAVPTLLDPVPGQGDMWAMMISDAVILQVGSTQRHTLDELR